MSIKINCIKNDSGVLCKDKRIKRSLFGIGARVCKVAENQECEYQDKYPRPEPPMGCGFSDKIKIVVNFCCEHGVTIGHPCQKCSRWFSDKTTEGN